MEQEEPPCPTHLCQPPECSPNGEIARFPQPNKHLSDGPPGTGQKKKKKKRAHINFKSLAGPSMGEGGGAAGVPPLPRPPSLRGPRAAVRGIWGKLRGWSKCNPLCLRFGYFLLLFKTV